MVANLNPKLTEIEAQGAANQFILDNLPDRFLAIEPRFDPVAQVWRLPVVISYPRYGPVGEVGEITVSAYTEEIVSHTSLDQMREKARQLYERHREAIQAAFLQTGNA